MENHFINTADFWQGRLNKQKGILLRAEEIKSLNDRNLNNPITGLNNLQDIFEKDNSYILGVTLRRTKVKITPVKQRICKEDPAFDDNLESALLPYEPVVIKAEETHKDFFYIIAGNTKGYVLKRDIAIAKEKHDWDIFLNPNNFYIVKSNIIEGTSDYERLYMGVKIPTVIKGIGITPVADEKNNLCLKNIHIEGNNRFNFGYLDFTEENILRQAFLCIGDLYGWGGDFNSRDCSSFAGEVFRCFGIYLGRNVSNQIGNGVKNYNIASMTVKEKEELICTLNIGSQLIFKGHTTMYIGNISGKPYIIHALSSMGDYWGSKIKVSKVVVSTTDITRYKTGKSFTESFTDIASF